MRIKLGAGLLPLNLLVMGLVAAVILSPSNMLRTILGIPAVLFFPGYALIMALFPRRRGMGGIERVAFSLGMSLVVVPLIGLVLNTTPWGIRLEPIVYSVASFIFIMSVIAWFRQKRVPEEERFRIEFHLRVPGWSRNALDKALSILLMVAILGVLGTLGYVIASPRVEEEFTLFYFLGPGGEATAYPKELSVGEEGKVVVGITNEERETVSYEMEIRIDGVRNSEVKGITLEPGQKWENEVSFTPTVAGEKQKVEFLLYKKGEVTPYLEPLHLWIDVREQ